MLPIAAAAGVLPAGTDSKTLVRKAAGICRDTAVEDAVCFYKAFGQLPVPVMKTDEAESPYDLTNPAAFEKIQRDGVTLFNLMEMGAARDMVAREWVNGFEKSLLFSKKLQENKARFLRRPEMCFGSVINSAVIYTFLEFLAAGPDTFISTKFDEKTAAGVQRKAAKILFRNKGRKNEGTKNKGKRRNLKKMIPKIKKLDNVLHNSKMNPGSTADIAAAGIFIALLNGMTL